MTKKYLNTLYAGLGAFMFICSPAYAWHAEGKVLCDVNQSGSIDSGDQPLSSFGYPNVTVNAVDAGGVRRCRGPGARAAARQDVAGGARGQGGLRGSALPVHGDPLPLAGRRAGHGSGGVGGHGQDAGRHSDGAAAP